MSFTMNFMVKLPKQPSFLYLGVSFEPDDFFKSQYPQGFDHEIFFGFYWHQCYWSQLDFIYHILCINSSARLEYRLAINCPRTQIKALEDVQNKRLGRMYSAFKGVSIKPCPIHHACHQWKSEWIYLKFNFSVDLSRYLQMHTWQISHQHIQHDRHQQWYKLPNSLL